MEKINKFIQQIQNFNSYCHLEHIRCVCALNGVNPSSDGFRIHASTGIYNQKEVVLNWWQESLIVSIKVADSRIKSANKAIKL